MILRGQSARLSGAVPAIAAVTSIWVVFHSAGIRVNTSPSLPIGLYRTTSDPRAKLVEFCPSEPSAALSVSRGYRARGNCPDGGGTIDEANRGEGWRCGRAVARGRSCERQAAAKYCAPAIRYKESTVGALAIWQVPRC